MTINDLVNIIYSLNDVKDGFWKDYLERIRHGMKVTWYHAAGFDLRPLHIIFSLAQPSSVMSKIGLELYNTDLVYSNIGYGMGYDFYSTFLNIWNKKNQGIDLNDSDLPHWSMTHCTPIGDVNGIPTAEAYSSIEPFSLFTKEERMRFKNGDYGESANQNREYDGFAIKLKYYTKTYITIIYLCLDDLMVKRLFDTFNIEVVCLFENAPIGVGIENLLKSPDDYNNAKYIFSDFSDRWIPDENYNVWRLAQYSQSYEPIACAGKFNRGMSFGLAINKNTTATFICPYRGSSSATCLRVTNGIANLSECPYASEKVELNLQETYAAWTR